MAQVPESPSKSPYAAAPEKIGSPVPQSKPGDVPVAKGAEIAAPAQAQAPAEAPAQPMQPEPAAAQAPTQPEAAPESVGGYDYKQLDLIEKNLAPMGDQALGRLFERRGLSPKESSDMMDVINYIRKTKNITPEYEPDFTKAETYGRMAAGMVNGVGEAAEMALERPGEFAQKAAPVLRDMALGVVGGLPAMGAGAIAGAIPLAGPVLAPVVAGGVAAAGLSEATENALRSILGLPRNDYDKIETAGAAISGFVSGLGKGAKRLLEPAIQSQGRSIINMSAAEGLQYIQNGLKGVARQLGESKAALVNGSPEFAAAFAQQAEETLMARFQFHLNKAIGNAAPTADDQFKALGQALADVPELVEARNRVSDFKRVFSALNEEQIQEVTKTGIQGMQRASKQRMSAIENVFLDSVKKAEALPVGVAQEGLSLSISRANALSAFEQAISDVAPAVVGPMSDAKILFKNGKWYQQSPGKALKAFTEAESLDMTKRLSQTDYGKTLLQEYENVRTMAPTTQIVGPQVKTVLSDRIPLSEFIRVKQQIGKNLPAEFTSGGQSEAIQKSYSIFNSLENDVVENIAANSYNPAFAEAAQNYLRAKEYSRMAAELFDADKANLIGRLNQMPSVTAAAVVNELSDKELQQFVRLSESNVLGQRIMSQSARKSLGTAVLQNELGPVYGKVASKSGTLTKEAMAEIEESVTKLMSDSTKMRKLKILLGEDAVDAAFLDLKKSLKVIEKYQTEMEIASKLKGPAAQKAAENVQKAFVSRALDVVTAVAGKGVPGFSRSSWPIVRALFEKLGNSEVAEQISRLMVMDMDNLVIPFIEGTEDAVLFRQRIASTVTKSGGDARRILGKYDQLAEARIRALRGYVGKGVAAASMGSSAMSAAPDALMRVMGGPIAPANQDQAAAQ